MKNFYIFLYGFFSIFCQTYLLRETIFFGGGNELTIGLFFFSWFIGIFFGAIYGKNFKAKEYSFIKFLTFFPFITFLNYFFVCLINFIIPSPIGAEPNFLRAFFSSFGFAFIPSFLVGFLFPLSVFYKKNLPSVFLLESIGSFTSGILLTFFFLKFFSFYKAILLISIILFSFSYKYLKFLIIFPFLLYFFEKNFNVLRYKSLGITGKVEKEIQSPYQNIILSKLNGTDCIYLNGRFLSQFSSEEELILRYFPFFLIPEKCENLLIYGFPIGNEGVFKGLNIKKVEIIEEDPFLVEKFAKNKKFYVKEDFRHFIKKKKNYYDLIIIDLNLPNSLLSSRLSTKEFFKEIKDSLKNGYLLFYMPIPENFWGKEVKSYAASIYYSLKEIFPYIEIGLSSSPFFLCSLKKFNFYNLEERAEKVFLENKGFSPHILNYFFKKERKNYFENEIKKQTKNKNIDKKPFIYIEILKLKSKLEGDKITYFLFFYIKYLFFSVFILPFFFLKKEKKDYFLVFSNGVIGIGLYLIISFYYQVRFGVFYSKVGLITSLFMLGLSFSPLFANFLYKKNFKAYFLDILLIIFLIFSFFLIDLGELFFYILFFFSGFLCGLPFTFIGLLKGGNQKAGAEMEAFDHIGAAIGSILTGLVMTPFFGINLTILIFLYLKIFSLILNLKK